MRDLSLQPRGEIDETVLEVPCRLVAENLASLRGVRETMANVAHPVFAGDTLYCSAKDGFIPGPHGGVYATTTPHQLRQTMRNPGPPSQRRLLALFELLSRFPESWGQIKFMHERFLGRQAHLIEYK